MKYIKTFENKIETLDIDYIRECFIDIECQIFNDTGGYTIFIKYNVPIVISDVMNIDSMIHQGEKYIDILYNIDNALKKIKIRYDDAIYNILPLNTGIQITMKLNNSDKKISPFYFEIKE